MLSGITLARDYQSGWIIALFRLPMIFISFFTPNGAYPALARKLKASLDRFELRSDVQLCPSFDNWAEGCRYKSRFILEKLFQYREPVVWMDIDTECGVPEMFFEHDFAIYN
jgi:hypothetical protein